MRSRKSSQEEVKAAQGCTATGTERNDGYVAS
jgi:hypothetical protein